MKRVCAWLCCSFSLVSLALAADPPKKAPADPKGAVAPAKPAPDGAKKGPAAPKTEEGKSALKTTQEKASYAIGLNMGQGMVRSNVELNIDLFVKGLRDGLSKAEPALSEKELEAAMMEFQQELAAKAAEKSETDAKANKEAGVAFLAANAKKEGIKTTASGLQYKVVKAGKGKSPKATDTVKAHYAGKLLDGTEFDNSYKRGEPLEIPVNRVIPGWTEALQLMKPGDKWQLFIPSELGYGARGTQGVIGPNATLVFDIELVEILDPAAEPVGEKPEK